MQDEGGRRYYEKVSKFSMISQQLHLLLLISQQLLQMGDSEHRFVLVGRHSWGHYTLFCTEV